MSAPPHNASYRRSSLEDDEPLTTIERELIQQVKEKLNSLRVFNFTIHQHETRPSRFKITLPTIHTYNRLQEICNGLKGSIRASRDNYFINQNRGVFVFELV